jgi:hypothetical protein
MTMTLSEIYAEYTTGSHAFCIAVEAHCGLEISRDEIERIADQSETASDFMDTWENDDSWTDI